MQTYQNNNKKNIFLFFIKLLNYKIKLKREQINKIDFENDIHKTPKCWS